MRLFEGVDLKEAKYTYFEGREKLPESEEQKRL